MKIDKRYHRLFPTDIVPEVLVAWSDRASLHLKEKQFKEAIECYEFLIEKLPGNEQIGEALDVARKLRETTDGQTHIPR